MCEEVLFFTMVPPQLLLETAQYLVLYYMSMVRALGEITHIGNMFWHRHSAVAKYNYINQPQQNRTEHHCMMGQRNPFAVIAKTCEAKSSRTQSRYKRWRNIWRRMGQRVGLVQRSNSRSQRDYLMMYTIINGRQRAAPDVCDRAEDSAEFTKEQWILSFEDIE